MHFFVDKALHVIVKLLKYYTGIHSHFIYESRR